MLKCEIRIWEKHLFGAVAYAVGKASGTHQLAGETPLYVDVLYI